LGLAFPFFLFISFFSCVANFVLELCIRLFSSDSLLLLWVVRFLYRSAKSIGGGRKSINLGRWSLIASAAACLLRSRAIIHKINSGEKRRLSRAAVCSQATGD
jgi:hypothetical protein